MERPILFSTAMVRALHAGQKTETRRLLTRSTSRWSSTLAWSDLDLSAAVVDEPYPGVHRLLVGHARFAAVSTGVQPRIKAGDTLLVRETWAVPDVELDATKPSELPDGTRVVFKADYPLTPEGEHLWRADGVTRWRPGIHLPHRFVRTRLEVVEVVPQRLHDITDADILAEGVLSTEPDTLRQAWIDLWDSINRDRASWASNPWVWVIRFEVRL